MIIALVNGGAHIDFRARDSHTALHRAAICGNYEAIQICANGESTDSDLQTVCMHPTSAHTNSRLLRVGAIGIATHSLPPG
ncbi:unnamed protein product [Hydatigera taeniaeformis]|uniref:ANK_REP_REGION domain-containing protein n=1 Tax=Hydatigena taeniaeformis TaxID=6205 RepID=A0A0R3WVX8_HYDTA|nr:unnamed protein product [Hydatigera taeniaeformis]